MSAKMIDTTIRNLSDYLDWLEVRTMEDTNMSHSNGGYCNADHVGHDEEYIDIKVLWGELNDEGTGLTINTEFFKIAVDTINDSTLTMAQKYAEMEHVDI